MLVKRIVTTIGIIVGMSALAHAAPISLQNATATFSQAGLSVGQTIDTITTGLNGWAIDPNEVNQSAVWETASNVGGYLGANFTFTLYNNFNDHAIGKFRISVTSDARATFADGLSSGGDVSATWTELTPQSAVATNGPTLTILGDNSILASGTNPQTTVYTVTATSSQTAITGIRLEVLEDPSLPFNGPGRQAVNGNFVLSEFQVDAVNLVPEPATALVPVFALLIGMRRRHRV